MARLIRAHAWKDAQLGPPASWPSPLRTAVEIMLGSGFPTLIWWGPQQSQLYNDAAIRIYGRKHPQALAQPASLHWDHFRNTLGVVVERAMHPGEAEVEQDVLLIDDERRSSGDGAWFNVTASLLRDDASHTTGVFITLSETTRRIRAETLVRASEVRAKKLFQQAPGIVLICNGREHVIEFTNDMAIQLVGTRDLPGRSLRQLAIELSAGPLLDLMDDAYRSGTRCEIEDLPLTRKAAGERPAQRKYFDMTVVPIIDSIGQITGTFVMGFDATERVRAHRMLREHAARQAFLLDVIDATRTLVDPVEMQGVIARMVGEQLRVSRAFYLAVDDFEGEACFVIDGGYHVPEVASADGRYPIAHFGSLVHDMLEGRSVAICNVAEESDLSEAERAAYFSLEIHAWCAVPLVKNGRTVAALCVHQALPRDWEDHEMALLEETAHRTWLDIDRANAEAALRRWQLGE